MDAFAESLGMDATALVVITLSAFLGAVVQGAIGFGLNLIVAPTIAAFVPEALPAAAIILALPMTLGSAAREFSHIDRSAILWTTIGRLPGIAVGLWIVMRLDAEALATATGGMVLFAVLMSLSSPRIPITPVTQAAAGWLGGVMGTSSSIGGPPLALLYQHSPGPVVRSTLGAAFLVGTGFSFGALLVAGEVQALHWKMGGAMVPAVLAGLFLSRALHGFLDRGWLRPCVLALCGIAGLAVALEGLAG
ncbi:MAG: sulfite exporter TauE/SafE family protein [Myxococcota bacterium]